MPSLGIPSDPHTQASHQYADVGRSTMSAAKQCYELWTGIKAHQLSKPWFVSDIDEPDGVWTL